MSFPRTTPLYQPMPGAAAATTEWPVSDPLQRPMPGALSDVGAERAVVLWQRRSRYAVGTLVCVGAVATRAVAGATHLWLSAAIIGAGYVLASALLCWAVRGMGSRVRGGAVGALAVSIDLVAAAGVVYCLVPPQHYDVGLLLGLVAAQMALVYYGPAVAVWALTAALALFVAASVILPAAVVGPPVDSGSVALSSLVFLGCGGLLLHAFGSFRSRMQALRRFCREVEVGELGAAVDARTERRPDDVTLLARSIDEMRHRLIELVGTDPLTGCLNRRAFETRVARECRQARRRGTSLTLLAVDVDHFKAINDTHGHPVGDYVLQTVADILRRTARDTDAVARLGGDEFVLVLADTSRPGAYAFAERLRANVDAHVFGDAGARLAVTISVGVAVASIMGEDTAAGLLAEADRSLYRAKAAGRNRISA